MMKLSIQWLRERTGFKGSIDELTHALIMAGIEVDAVEPAAKPLDKVVVGLVLRVDKHPDAERLHVCTVDIGQTEKLTIVCGASNVKSEMKVAVALIGGCVGDLKIKKAKLRGVESYGMICSSSELGLTETSEGIMPLPQDAPLGQDINAYLHLDDQCMTVELTPNRGDCLSVTGLAREVCAAFDLDYVEPDIPFIQNFPRASELLQKKPLPFLSARKPSVVQLQNPSACPYYFGQVIENINNSVETPLWLKECLRRSGLRSIDAIVDVMNYVMLEIGQPLHAFDLDKIAGNIQVRYAKHGESIPLLDDKSYELDSETLIIADEKKPLAIAGIMGGKDSAVSAATTRIFIESAYFEPRVISKKARQYGLHTDASHRFERGVDYCLQRHAIERATKLIIEIFPACAVGDLIEEKKENYLPEKKSVTLRYAQIKKLLGIEVAAQEVQHYLEKLGFNIENKNESQCQVKVPSHRFDVSIEQDLIEEIARCYDLNKIPNQPLIGELQVSELDDTKISMDQCRQLLIERDYHEAVTYSFVSPELQVLLNLDKQQIPLINPISSDMGVMRTSLIPGLLNAVQYNQARQQNRIRLFEIATCFHASSVDKQPAQETLMLAGICSGFWQEPQWEREARKVDFFDVKADMEALFHLSGEPESFHWQADNLPMMHPGQCAAIYRNDKKIGFLGVLHPTIVQKLDISAPVFAFECNFNELAPAKLAEFAKLSKYPSIKRDIAFLVDKNITAGELFNFIQQHASDWLIKLQLFDVYQGTAGAMDKKSLAFSLTIQHPSRTLQDSEVDELISRLIQALQQEYGIILRGEE